MRVLIILLMSFVSTLAMADKVIVDAPADVKYLCGPDKNSNVRELLFPEIRLQVRNKETTKVVLILMAGNCINGVVMTDEAQSITSGYVFDIDADKLNTDSAALPSEVFRADQYTHTAVLYFNNELLHSTKSRQILLGLKVRDGGEYQVYIIFDEQGRASVAPVAKFIR